jgi:hypothetical protein
LTLIGSDLPLFGVDLDRLSVCKNEDELFPSGESPSSVVRTELCEDLRLACADLGLPEVVSFFERRQVEKLLAVVRQHPV